LYTTHRSSCGHTLWLS